MVPSKGAWSILTGIDKSMHRHKRRLLSKMLSEDALRDFEPIMIEYVNMFMGQLVEDLDMTGWSTPKNMITHCE